MRGWGSSTWGASKWGSGDVREHIPTSPEFPSADVQGPNILNLPDYLEVWPSRDAPWITQDLASLGLKVENDGGDATTIGIGLDTSDSWTLEITFRPDQLPPDLNSLDTNRLFIGAYDEQGPGCGLVISRAGLAIVSEPTGSAFPIPGSQSLVPEGADYYTLRIAVNAAENVTNIYITKTSLVATKGQTLRFTTGAIQAPSDSSDGVLIDLVGTGATPTKITLKTVRFNGHTMLIPNQRPVANPGKDQGVSVGATVKFDGSKSYDPEGAPLTYFWSLIAAPDKSTFKISGIDGYTSPDSDNAGFTYLFNDLDLIPPSNTGVFSVDNAPVLQPGDTLLVGGQQYTVAIGAPDQVPMWFKPPGTAKYVRNTPANVAQWRAALPDDWTDNWSDSCIAVTEELLPDDLSGQSWIIIHSATFFDDQTKAIPGATPDASGLYEPQLTVNDGELDSIPELALLNVAQTSLTMGVIPDVSFIWNYLSNFWPMIEDEDRYRVETVWSGFAQAAADILMTAWQIDYNKSLKDIQKVFQRRWLKYNMLLDDDSDTAKIRFVRAPIFSGVLSTGADVAGKTLEVIFDGGKIETVEFQGTVGVNLSVTEMAQQINAQLGIEGNPLAVEGFDQLVLDYSMLVQITPNGTANANLGWSTYNYTQNDLHGLMGLPQPSNPPTLPDEVWYKTATIFDIQDPGIDLIGAGVTPEDLLVLDGVGYRIQLLDPALRTELLDLIPLPAYPTPTTYIEWSIPSVVTSTVNDFTQQLVTSGDLARFTVAEIATDNTYEIHCNVLGVSHERLGFDPTPLWAKYNGHPERYTTTFLGVRRVNNIPVDPLVAEIPRLQEIIKDPSSILVQDRDYVVQKGVIVLAPGVYTLLDPPPDVLWAEITYLDNRPAIDANFGTLVGLSVEEATSIENNLDYLSAVRGLWYAYFSGPSLESVRIGMQILLGLPFAEEAGFVESIDPNFSAKQGRIFLRDVSNPAVVRGYFYPLLSQVYDQFGGLASKSTAGVSVDPANKDKPIAVGDKIPQFAPLSSGVEVLDWVKGAKWGALFRGAFSEVEKFFRFAVRANVDSFNLANLGYAIKFVLQIKPHYTYPTFIALKNIDPDLVNVDDAQTAIVHKLIVSTPDTINIGGYRYDDDVAGDAFNPPYNDLVTDGVCLHRFDRQNDPNLLDPYSNLLLETAATGDMSVGRAGLAAVTYPNGKVYVFGGQSVDGPHINVDAYDPISKTFSHVGNLLFAKDSPEAVILYSGKILVYDGSLQPEVYDPFTNTSVNTGPPTIYRKQGKATKLYDGRVLVSGGLTTGSVETATAEIYDSVTNAFTATGSMPVARHEHTATLLHNGLVLVIGGSNSTGFQASASLYNPATGTFTPTGSLTEARAKHTATLMPDGTVVVIGGENASGFLASVEVYTPSTGVFVSKGHVHLPRKSHTAALFSDSRILVSGGESTAGVSNSLELFDTRGFYPIAFGQMQTPRTDFATVRLLDGTYLEVGGQDVALGIITGAEVCSILDHSFVHDRPILFPGTKMAVYAYEPLSGTPRFDSIWAFDDGVLDIVLLSGPAPSPPPYGALEGPILFDMGLPGGSPNGTGVSPPFPYGAGPAPLLVGLYTRAWYPSFYNGQ
jgi:hypothetical protein